MGLFLWGRSQLLEAAARDRSFWKGLCLSLLLAGLVAGCRRLGSQVGLCGTRYTILFFVCRRCDLSLR
jgi:hypothetical protein